MFVLFKPLQEAEPSQSSGQENQQPEGWKQIPVVRNFKP